MRGREQDIRRAKANSNICTNQALTALAATVYTALMGPEGLREWPSSPSRRTHYLAERLQASGFRLQYPDAPFLWEFAVELPDVKRANEALLEAGIVGGLDLGDGAMLVAVTEKRTKENSTPSWRWLPMPFNLIRDKGREGRRGYTLPKPDVEMKGLENHPA